MSQEFDEVVADSMAWYTDDVEVPDGLAARARTHVRRRRHATMGWAATGTALAATAAICAGTLGAGTAVTAVAKNGQAPGATAPGTTAHHGISVQTTALVVSRVDRALAKAATGKPVAFIRQVNHGVKEVVLPPHGKPAVIQGNVTKTWSRGPLSYTEVVNSAGKIQFGKRTELRSGHSVETSVAYPQKVWWRGTYDAPSTAAPSVGCTLGETERTSAQWAKEVRKLLSCGAKVAGVEQVDGVKAVKLKLSSSYKTACAASNYQSKCTPVNVGWSGVLWANASTFMPVRLIAHGHHYSFRIDFRWLAPNAANLARLRPQVPAGFHHV